MAYLLEEAFSGLGIIAFFVMLFGSLLSTQIAMFGGLGLIFCLLMMYVVDEIATK